MNFLRRAMTGRNGMDQLSLTLLALGLLLNLLGAVLPVRILGSLLGVLAYACMVVVIFRIISRDLYRRRTENNRFLTMLGRVQSWFRLRLRMLREIRQYKYFKCPSCTQRLRVPRGAGHIRVSCKKCGESFARRA